jgi:hypothetical protein
MYRAHPFKDIAWLKPAPIGIQPNVSSERPPFNVDELMRLIKSKAGEISVWMRRRL